MPSHGIPYTDVQYASIYFSPLQKCIFVDPNPNVAKKFFCNSQYPIIHAYPTTNARHWHYSLSPFHKSPFRNLDSTHWGFHAVQRTSKMKLSWDSHLRLPWQQGRHLLQPMHSWGIAVHNQIWNSCYQKSHYRPHCL